MNCRTTDFLLVCTAHYSHFYFFKFAASRAFRVLENVQENAQNFRKGFFRSYTFHCL